MNSRVWIAAAFVAAGAGMSQADTLWDQSALNWFGNSHPNTISGSPPFGSTAYTASDVSVPAGGWNVDSISMYFTNFDFSWAPELSGRLNIHPKTGAVPTYNPGEGAIVTMTTQMLNDPVQQQAFYKVTVSGLNTLLTEGDYWMSITPVAPSGFFGPEQGLPTNGVIGDISLYYSPFNSFGAPPANTWGNVSGTQDAAILVEGTLVPSPAGLALLGLAGLFARRRRA